MMIARTRERGVLERHLTGAPGARSALLISGEVGIGKTTLWSAAVDLAHHAGARVLAARGSSAETGRPWPAFEGL